MSQADAIKQLGRLFAEKDVSVVLVGAFAVNSYRFSTDIATLVKEHGVDVHSGSFRDLCLKYGTETTYKKILTVFEG